MIVTHAQNAEGQRRVYLGGKASLEAWIEPRDDGSWSFHLAEAVTGTIHTPDDQRQWAMHTLLKLAEALGVPPANLAAVPFEAVAALHRGDPFEGRRIPSPKRRTAETGFLSTRPAITRPAHDFRTSDTPHARDRG